MFFTAGLNAAVIAAALFRRNAIEGIAAPDETHELLPMWWWTIMKALLCVAVFCIAIGFAGDIFAPAN